MKISYSMLTHNEDESLLRLIDFIVEHKDEEDEIEYKKETKQKQGNKRKDPAGDVLQGLGVLDSTILR